MSDDELWERAEQLLGEIDTMARDFDIYEFGLPFDGKIRVEMRDLVMSFAREFEARGWEGAAELANAMPMATSHNVAVRLKLVARRLREEL